RGIGRPPAKFDRPAEDPPIQESGHDVHLRVVALPVPSLPTPPFLHRRKVPGLTVTQVSLAYHVLEDLAPQVGGEELVGEPLPPSGLCPGGGDGRLIARGEAEVKAESGVGDAVADGPVPGIVEVPLRLEESQFLELAQHPAESRVHWLPEGRRNMARLPPL